MEEHMDNEPKDDIGIKCFKPYECEFWEYCTRNLPKPNVFDIKGGMHLDKMMEKFLLMTYKMKILILNI